MTEQNTAPAEVAHRPWFVALVAYYILAFYLVPSTAKVERFSFAYFAMVVPAWLYIAVNWRNLISGYATASKLLASFAIMAGVSGVVRGDLSLAYNAVFLAAMAIVILNSKVYLTVVELNWMFLATIIGSVAVYYLKLTEYGFLPGQAEAQACHEALNWRISLFRVPAESAMFSFVALVTNMLYGDRLSWRVRGLFMLVAVYFLVFSGVRSIVLPGLAVSLILGARLYLRSPGNVRRSLFVLGVGVVAIIWSVPYSLGKAEGFWKNYLLRTQTCDYKSRYSLASTPQPAKNIPSDENIPSDWYAWTFNRHCATKYQLSIFANSLLGNADVQPKSDQELSALGCPTDQLNYYCASCNFSTYWLARAGIFAFPLLMSFFALLIRGLIRREATLTWSLVMLAAVSFSWGVILVPYNPIFLLMLALPAIFAAYERHEVQS